MNSFVDFNEISALDLDPIKQKLMHVESGEGWTLAQANAVEVEYRRFLYLMKKFPNEQTSPSVAVDTFWHYHILDTMKYAVDCEHVFGYFLHHYPYVGMHGEDADAEHHSSGERMRELYEQTFGASYNPGAAFCGIVHPPAQAAAVADAAFCGIVHPPAQAAGAADAAFCGIVRPTVQAAGAADAAFCGIVRPTVQGTSTGKAAFCGIVRPTVQGASSGKAAFCGIVRPTVQDASSAKAAFCGIVRPTVQDASSGKAAFCGIVRPTVQDASSGKAAFCGIVRPTVQDASSGKAAFCGLIPPAGPASEAKAAFASSKANQQGATAYCALGKLPHGAKGDAIRTNVGVATAAAH